MLRTEELCGTLTNKWNSSAYYANAAYHEIAKEYFCFFAGGMGIENAESLYAKYRTNSYDVPRREWESSFRIYDIYDKTWRKSLFLIHLINVFRVKWNVKSEIKSNEIYSPAKLSEVAEISNAILEKISPPDNKYLNGLLATTIVNYNLRQIGLPNVTGKNITEHGITDKSLSEELNNVIELWTQR
jgi:hypothetical protein